METMHVTPTSSSEPIALGEILHGDEGVLATLAKSAFEGVEPDDITKGESPSDKAAEDL